MIAQNMSGAEAVSQAKITSSAGKASVCVVFARERLARSSLKESGSNLNLSVQHVLLEIFAAALEDAFDGYLLLC